MVSHWEDAYLRFETPDQEVRKFRRRLLALGAGRWPRNSRVVELFCGRANGVRALAALGFERVEGIDLSLSLVSGCRTTAQLFVGDCRQLPFPDASRDIAVVQGGLHHLPRIPEDLRRTLAETARFLEPGGRLVVVEPWSTPFLGLVHQACESVVLRRVWPKLDAFATMIEHERATYEAWLGQPDVILAMLNHFFEADRSFVRFGKLFWIGRSRGRRFG
jgi:ubiquinone/menaquinone biosynthesis C-methylase UbiE